MNLLDIDRIRIDGGTQTRQSVRGTVVDEYAEPLEDPAFELPDVVAFDDGQEIWMGDGFYRIAAYRKAKRQKIPVDLRKGTKRDALLFSAGSNSTHGQPRTNEDKRNAVQMLLGDEEWAQASDRWIAEKCKVSHPLVASLRSNDDSTQKGSQSASGGNSSTSNNNGSGNTRTGKDGKKYPATNGEQVFCSACERKRRVGMELPSKCPDCAELRKPKGKKKPTKSRAERRAEPSEVVDAFGVVVPKRCKDAFCDPWIQEAIDFLGVTVARFWEMRLADGMNKRKKHYPFFMPKDFIDGVAMAGNTMEQILEHLKEMRPVAVCPACEGKGCGECRESGLVPRELHKKLKAKAK